MLPDGSTFNNGPFVVAAVEANPYRTVYRTPCWARDSFEVIELTPDGDGANQVGDTYHLIFEPIS